MTDTIVFSDSWLRHHPEKKERYGEGLLVVLDPKDTAAGVDERAKEAMVMIAGSHPKSLPIDLIETKSGLVGLFFRGAKESEIPRGARITIS